MTCDRQSHRVGAAKHNSTVIEVEIYNTAGTDSENRELCYTCIVKAINDGHEVLFATQLDEDNFYNSMAWNAGLVEC